MKALIFFLTAAFFFLYTLFFIPSKAFSQIQFFDSVNVIASSDLYDYKNPVFENQNSDLNNIVRFTYERHLGNKSDIILRSVDYNNYSAETVISNSQNALNINPSFTENIIVWQSNERGNWDIYCSYYSGSGWSEPVILDSSASEDTEPYIFYNNTFPVEYNYYFLVYKKNEDIHFKRFKTSVSQWDLDTNITQGIQEECITPLIYRTSGSSYAIAYLKKYSDTLSKITISLFLQSVSGNISWNSPFEIISQPNSQKNITLLRKAFFGGVEDYLTFDYDTLGTVHSVGIQLQSVNSKDVFTKNIPGKHSTALASTMGLITDNTNYLFTVFGCKTINFDSSMLTLAFELSNLSLGTYYKRVYLGDTSVTTRFGLSLPVNSFNYNYYKIRAVWEKSINGKTALVESYMFDFIGDVSENNVFSGSYSLSQNYPNPFNPNTKIEYELQLPNRVSIKVFDIQGKEIETFINRKQNEGKHYIEFDGSGLASGVYFYSFIIKNTVVDTKKMILIR